MRSILSFAACLSLAVLGAGCDDDPVGITGSEILLVEYRSSVQPGSVPPAEAGFCAHHMLGSSWLDFVAGSADTVQLFGTDEPKTYRGTTVVTPAGIEYRVAIRDLECCTHAADEPCWPTDGLAVNGVAVTRVVALPTDLDPDRIGLAFRVDRSGRILP